MIRSEKEDRTGYHQEAREEDPSSLTGLFDDFEAYDERYWGDHKHEGELNSDLFGLGEDRFLRLHSGVRQGADIC